MKPKFLIDTVSLLLPLTGIGRYTYEISSYLKEKKCIEVNYFYGYYSKNFIDNNQVKSQFFKYIKIYLSRTFYIKKIIRKIISVFSKYNSPSFDLYWQPSFIPVDGINAKKIVTSVHDFSFLLYREFHPKERIEYFDKYFFTNIYQSDFLITGSEYSKKEILDKLDFKDEKVKVIYHGINHDIFKVYNSVELDFKVPKKFILSVGSLEPRKNFFGLLQAYNSLDIEVRNEYGLVIVGSKGWKSQEIIELIDKNKDNIYYLGFVSDEELAKVYNLASCFVFPSFYEGFGLPLIESMACGTPVITSNLTSMPEVCSDAAIYFDPYDINEMKEKIEQVLEDKCLQSKMIEKGFQRASEFTWEKSSSQHLELFKEILKS